MFSNLSDTIRAAIWMMGAVISFSAMAVSGREISFDLDTFEIMTYRSIIGVIIMVTLTSAFGKWSQIRTQRFGLHFFRNLGHFTGQNLWFFAITLIPFAQLFAFEFSVPIWVMLAAPFVLGEKLTPTRVICVLVGFVGILIVTRPWSAGLSPGIIAAALCALGFACATLLTKKLTSTESTLTILFWLTVMQLVMGLVCAGYDGDISLPKSHNIFWIFVIGFGGLFAHFCITRALQLAPATLISPVDFTRLPIIATIGYVFYSEALDIWVILGAVLIFAANYVNIWSETRKKRAA